MTNLPPNLLNHAKASEAQIALIKMMYPSKSRRGIGLPVVATLMPVILACAVVLSLSHVAKDQTGVASKKSEHVLLPGHSNAARPEEI